MDPTRDEIGILRELIRQETVYLKHYDAKVVDRNDPLKKGRVLVIVPDLGWDDESKGAWACPREMHRLSVPKVGEWVEVYFKAGDRSRMCYLGIELEMKDQKPKNAEPEIHVLFENPVTDDSIKYTESTGAFSVKNKKADLKTIIDELFDQIKAIITTGSPTTHTVSAASQTALDAVKAKFDNLIGAG